MRIIKLLFTVYLIFQVFSIGLAQIDTIHVEEILVKVKQSGNLLKSCINAKSLELNNKHDVGEIFSSEAGFGVIKRGNYAMEPVLRGFKYEQLNVQYNNGCTSANACPNRMDPAISQVAPEDIEKIEVIKGPYSVRFGQSFGGLINVVTKLPLKTDKFKIKGSVNGGYKSNGSSTYSGVDLFMANKKYDVTLNAGYKNFGDYKSGDDQEIASSFKRVGYSTKFGYNFSNNQRVQLNWNQGFATDIKHAGLPMDANKDNSSLLSLDYMGQNLSERLFSLKVKIYGSYVDHEMDNAQRPNYAMTHAVTPVTAQVIGGRAELGLKMSGNTLTYIGVDYKSIGKNGTRTREVLVNVCTDPPTTFDPPKIFEDLVWQDSKINDMGAYIENRFKINDDLLWVMGARLDMVSYQINDPAPDFNEHYNNDITPDNQINVAANTSLKWQVGKNTELQWAVGRGIRSPKLDEMFINHFSIGMDAYEYLGNPNLKPEVNYQSDIRVNHRWNNATAYVNVFYSYLNNYILAKVDTSLDKKFLTCKPPAHAKRFVNIDEAYMYGFEMGFNIRFLKTFNYSLSAGYTYAQNITWDEPLSEIPPFTLNSSVGYKTNKFETLLSARIVSGQTRIAGSFDESTTPAYELFDITVEYNPIEMIEVFASITNIFDKNYVDHLSRVYKNMDVSSLYYEPGRSFNIGVKVNF
ncbi:MAG: TonB-dependent receptor [Bacteroidota bacterium]|nr:TonB-dependent receptor [Bacteroidota bacterium]